MTLTCKFCGNELIGGVNHRFVVPDRRGVIVDEHTGDECNDGECLNRAGHLTRHHPDAPEYNGGIDYSDGRARFVEAALA